MFRFTYLPENRHFLPSSHLTAFSIWKELWYFHCRFGIILTTIVSFLIVFFVHEHLLKYRDNIYIGFMGEDSPWIYFEF